MKTKEVLNEWRKFLKEESLNKDMQVFFNFVKKKLPVIVTSLGPAGLEFDNSLGLHCLDGNHRLQVFKKVSSKLSEEKQKIPTVLSVKNEDIYLQELLSYYKENEIEKLKESHLNLLNIEGRSIISKKESEGEKIFFINNLRISDITTGENKPTSEYRTYIENLFSEFKKENQNTKLSISDILEYQSSYIHPHDEEDDDLIIIS